MPRAGFWKTQPCSRTLRADAWIARRHCRFGSGFRAWLRLRATIVPRNMRFGWSKWSLGRGSPETLGKRLTPTWFSIPSLRPVLAGVRSAAAAARQMVYEAEGFTVDLRFDRKPHSNAVHLIGQILDSARTGTLLRTLPVTLCTDTDVLIAEGSTNDLGEFHLEFEALDHLRLSIWTRSKLIRIVLANLRLKVEFGSNGYRTDAGNQ